MPYGKWNLCWIDYSEGKTNLNSSIAIRGFRYFITGGSKLSKYWITENIKNNHEYEIYVININVLTTLTYYFPVGFSSLLYTPTMTRKVMYCV